MNLVQFKFLLFIFWFSSTLYAVDIPPQFKYNYIEMVSSGSTCGLVRITLKDPQQTLILKTNILSQSLFSNTWEIQRLSELQIYGTMSFMAKYDWGGPRPSFHYRITCSQVIPTLQKEGPYHGELVPCKNYPLLKNHDRCLIIPTTQCKDYVLIESIQHNTKCEQIDDKYYEPFKMDQA